MCLKVLNVKINICVLIYVKLYQFRQSLMMLSPGRADSQSVPAGRSQDALLESEPATDSDEHQRTNQ